MAEKKRIVALLLAILMFVQMLPVSAMAEGWNTYVSQTYSGVASTEYTFEVAESVSDGVITYKELTKQLVEVGSTPVWPDIPDFDGYTVDTADPWVLVEGTTTYRPNYAPIETITVTVNFVYSDNSTAKQSLVYTYNKNADNEDLTVTVDAMTGFDLDKTEVKDANNASVTLTVNADKTAATFIVPVSTLTANAVYTVKYIGAQTTYTVNHNKQNIDNSEYTTTAETKTGYVGDLTEAAAKSDWATGFTVRDFDQAHIAPNGQTVIDIYYDRNTYALNYVTSKDSSGNAITGATYVDGEILPYEKVVTLPTVTAPGYTFKNWVASWTEDGETKTETLAASAATYTMPAHDVTLTAQWEAATTAKYTVMYWVQGVDVITVDGVKMNLVGSDGKIENSKKYYEFLASEEYTGTVGTTPTSSFKTTVQTWGLSSTFFSYNDANSDVKATIAADGSTVYNVRFDRAVITFTFKDLKTVYGLYGQTFKQAEADGIWPGGLWSGNGSGMSGDWTYLDGFYNSKLTGLSVTFTQQNTSGNRYVYQLIRDTDGKTWKVADTFKGSFNYFNLTSKFEPGFTIIGYSHGTSAVTNDSSIIKKTSGQISYSNNLYIYNERQSFKITYKNCLLEDGTAVPDTTVLFEKELPTPTFTVIPPAGVDSDYVFAGWYREPTFKTPVNWGVDKMPAANLVVYAKWTPPVKTVEFHLNYEGEGVTDPYARYSVYKYDSLSTHHYSADGYVENPSDTTIVYKMPDDPTREGYTFGGWFTDAACTKPLTSEFLTVTIAKDWDIYAKWTSTEEKEVATSAAVSNAVGEAGEALETYIDYDGTEKKVADLMPTETGLVGTTVTLTAPDIPGYIADEKYVVHTFVEGENTVVFYYSKLDTWDLTIRYVDVNAGEDDPDIAASEKQANITDTQVAVSYKALPNGEDTNGVYMWQLTSDAVVTATESSNAVIFYYQKVYQKTYTVEYYYQNADSGEYAIASNETQTKREWAGYTLTETPAATKGNYTLNTDLTGVYESAALTSAITDGKVVKVVPQDGTFVVRVYYALNTAKYTIEHYQMDVNGSYPTTPTETESDLSGRIGQTVTATAKTYTGFTEDKTYSGRIAEGQVSADGKLVLKLYYERNKHDVTYSYTEGTTVPAGAPAVPAGSKDVLFGTAVTVATAPTLAGWTFSGWTTSSKDVTVTDGTFTMPDNDVAFTGSWERVTQTVSGKKTWDGEPTGGASLRPTIVIQLMQTYEDENGDEVTEEVAGCTQTITNASTDKEISYSWNNLPTHTEYGKPIDYKVVEKVNDVVIADNGTMEGTNGVKYEAEYSGTNVTNTLKTANLTIAKTVEPNGFENDGYAAQEFEFTVKNGNTVVESFTLKHGQSKTLENLQVGVTYTIEETANLAFTTTWSNKEGASENTTVTLSANTTVTATNTRKKISIPVEKTWSGNEPDDSEVSVGFELYDSVTGDQQAIDTMTVNAESEWKGEFTNLPYGTVGGTLITYTVKETKLNGYTSDVDWSEDGTKVEVTNTYTGDPVDKVTITKTWDDANNQDGLRPAAADFKVSLKLGEEEKYSVSGADWKNTDTNTWTAEISSVVAYDNNGEKITYTVEETAVTGYTADSGNTTALTPADGTTVTLKNKHTVQLFNNDGKLTVSKVWNDAGNAQGKRTKSVTVQLTQNGKEYASVTLSEANNWSHTWSGLPANVASATLVATNTPAKYNVVETAVTGYTTSYDPVTTNSASYTITNTIAQVDRTISGTKTWVDTPEDTRQNPLTLTIERRPAGTEAEWESVADYTVTIENTTASDSQPYSKTVDKFGYDEETGTAYVYEYRVVEETLSGYTAVYEPEGGAASFTDDEATVSITNTSNTVDDTVTVKITKNWADHGNYAGLRPAKAAFTVTLTSDAATYTISGDAWEGENNAAKWTEELSVRKYDNAGNAITYTVTETDLTDIGYKADSNNTKTLTPANSMNPVTLTNTYEPTVATVTAVKNWADNYDAMKLRPTSITLQLLADGVPAKDLDGKDVSTQTVNAVETAMGQNVSWENLPVYKAGAKETGDKIVYTVKELKGSTVLNAGDSIATNSTAIYVVSYGDDGLNVTNTLTDDTVAITATKNWDIPSYVEESLGSATLKLQRKLASADDTAWADVKDAAQLNVEARTDGTKTWSGLLKYDANGCLYAYRVVEVYDNANVTVMDGEENALTSETKDNSTYYPQIVTLDSDNTGSVTFVNTYNRAQKNALTVKKVIDSSNLAEGVENKGNFVITVERQNPDTEAWVAVTTVTLTDVTTESSKQIAEQLAVGTYRVREYDDTTLKIWTPDYDADDNNVDDEVTLTTTNTATLTVTNRRVLADDTAVTFTKQWEDNGNALNVRPETDAFKAMLKISNNIDETVIESAAATITPEGTASKTATSWTIKFTNLPKYSLDGVEYGYTLKEELNAQTALWYTQDVANVVAGGTITNTLQTIDSDKGVTVTKQISDADVAAAAASDTFTIALTLPAGPDYKAALEAEVVELVKSDGIEVEWSKSEDDLPANVITLSGVGHDDSVTLRGYLPVGTYSVEETVVNTAGNKFTYKEPSYDPENGSATLEAGKNQTFTVTNEHQDKAEKITVYKNWEDKNGLASERPTVKFVLKYNNAAKTVVKELPLEADAVSVAFEDVPYYADGYIVEEVAEYAEGAEACYETYVTEVDGTKLPNTEKVSKYTIGVNDTSVTFENRRKTTNATVTKKLTETSLGDTFYFSYDVGELKDQKFPITVNAGKTSAEWTLRDLPVGATLKVTETDRPDYYSDSDKLTASTTLSSDSTKNTIEITNTRELTNNNDTGVVLKKKTDDRNETELADMEFEFEYWINGVKASSTITLKAENEYKHVFTDVRLGDKLVIEETDHDDYTLGSIDVTVDAAYDYATHTEEVDNRTVTIDHAANGTEIVFTNNRDKVKELAVRKIWKDAAGKSERPQSVTFIVKGTVNGQENLIEDTEITLTKDDAVDGVSDTWEKTVEGLPKTYNGKDVEYSLLEKIVPPGYDEAYDDDGDDDGILQVTNTLTGEISELVFKKVWVDSGDTYLRRPEVSDFVEMLSLENSNDEGIDQIPEINSEGNTWTITYKKLPVYDAEGNKLSYTLTETLNGNTALWYGADGDVSESTWSGETQQTDADLKNTLKMRKVTIEKVVEDESALANLNSSEFQIEYTVEYDHLTKANREAADLSGQDSLKDKTANPEDNSIEFYVPIYAKLTVTEDTAAGTAYNVTYNGSANFVDQEIVEGTTVTVKNTRVYTTISGEKVWNSVIGETAPEKIQVTISGEAGEEEVVAGEATVALTTDSETGEITFVVDEEDGFKLPKYRYVMDGEESSCEEITYSITDECVVDDNGDKIDGYWKVSINGTEIVNDVQKGSFTLTKTGESNGAMEGVDFVLTSLTDPSATPITKTTDENGEVEFKDIPLGTYTLSETEGDKTSGYKPMPELTVVVTGNTNNSEPATVTVTVKNPDTAPTAKVDVNDNTTTNVTIEVEDLLDTEDEDDNSNSFTLTKTVVDPDGYTGPFTFNVTLTHENPNLTSFTVKKDGDDYTTDTSKPVVVKVSLSDGEECVITDIPVGTEITVEETLGDAADAWTVTGNEDSVQLTTDKREDSMTVTNTRKLIDPDPDNETDNGVLKVEKLWHDGEGNTLESRLTPETIKVQLYRNPKGKDSREAYKPLDLTADADWAGEFTDLPYADTDGTEFVYTVEEYSDNSATETDGDGDTAKFGDYNFTVAVVDYALDESNTPKSYKSTITNTLTDGTKSETNKTADCESAEIGQEITYTITRQNYLNTSATVKIEDILDEGLRYVADSATITVSTTTINQSITPVSVNPEESTDGEQTIVWNTAEDGSEIEVPPMATVTLTYTAVVTRNAAAVDSGKLNNKATVTFNGDSATEDDDGEEVTVDEPVLTITKSADKKVVEPGDTITYTLTVKNTGDGKATDLTVEDTMSASVTYNTQTVTETTTKADSTPVEKTADVTVADPDPEADPEVGQKLTWTIAEINSGETKTITYEVTVKEGAAAVDGEGVKNTAVITDDPTEPENPPEDEVVIPLARIDLEKTACYKDGSAITETTKVAKGNTITYKLTVTNSGSTALTGVTVTDEMFTLAVEDTLKVDGDAATLSGSVITIGELAASGSDGDSKDITFDYVVTEDDIIYGRLDGTTNTTSETDTKIVNHASATGSYNVDGEGGTVEAKDDVTINTVGNNGWLKITKELVDESADTKDVDKLIFVFEIRRTSAGENATGDENVQTVKIQPGALTNGTASNFTVESGFGVGIEYTITEIGVKTSADGEVNETTFKNTWNVSGEGTVTAGSSKAEPGSIVIKNVRKPYDPTPNNPDDSAQDGTITVNKMWLDQKEPSQWLSDELIPDEIKVSLMRDDVVYPDATNGTKELNRDNGWTTTFENLPHASYEGVRYTYTVEEIFGDDTLTTDDTLTWKKSADETYTYLVNIDDSAKGLEDHTVTVTNTLQDIAPQTPVKNEKDETEEGLKSYEIGDQVTFTIEYKSNLAKPGTATLTDILPEGLEYTDEDSWSLTVDGPGSDEGITATSNRDWVEMVEDTTPEGAATLVWTVQGVPAMGRVYIEFTVTVTQAAVANKQLTNFAYAYMDNPKNEMESDGEVIEIKQPKLVPGKYTLATDQAVKPGDTITYYLTLTNEGDGKAQNIDLSDTLPGQLDETTVTDFKLVDVSGVDDNGNPIFQEKDQAAEVERKGNVIEWHVDEIAAKTTLTLSFTVKVKSEADLNGATSIVNPLKIDSANGDDEPEETVPDPDTDEETEISRIDVVKDAKITDSEGKVKDKASLGDTITYTITVTNNGGSKLTNVEVKDSMFDGVKVTSVAVENGNQIGTKTPADGKVSVGDLEPNGKATITYTYTVVEQDILDGIIYNGVTATAKDPDGDDITKETTEDVKTDGMNGSLKITKQIVDNSDDKENGEAQEFTFELKLVIDGEEKHSETFTLGQGETKEFKEKLGIGLTYTITEIEAEDGQHKLKAWETTVSNKDGITTTTDVVISADDEDNTVTFTNTRKLYDPTPDDPDDEENDGTITVRKEWHDAEGKDISDGKMIPDSIDVALNRTGKTYPAELSKPESDEDEGWTHVYSGLPLADVNGEIYSYTVSETDAADGKVTYTVGGTKYTFEVTEGTVGNNYTVTNKLMPNDPDEPDKTADEEIKAGDENDGVEIGDVITYTITRTSHLATKATATITDNLPAGLEYLGTVSVKVDGKPAEYKSGETKAEWTIEDIPPMADIEVVFKAKVTKDAIVSSTIKNNATVKLDKDDPDVKIDAEQITNVLLPNLNLTKTDEGKGVRPEQKFAYTISLTNAAEDRRTGRATDLVVTDTLPTQVNFISVEAPEGTAATYDEETRTITWTIPVIEGTLQGAEPTKLELKINVQVKAELPEDAVADEADEYLADSDRFIVNSAKLYDDGVETPIDDTTVETCIARASVEKTATIIRSTDPDHPDMDGDLSTAALGDTIRYAVTVTNKGGCTLYDVTVYDVMIAQAVEGTVNPPELVETVKARTSDVTEIAGIKVLRQPVLEAGYSVTFTYDYVVTEEDILKGFVYNKATATANGPQGEDAYGSDDTTTETDDPAPKMSVVKEVVSTKETYRIGETVKYLITIKNTGNVTLNDLKVDDTLYSDLYTDEALYELLTPESTTLKPGESTTAAYEYKVQEGDVLPTYNEDGSIRKHLIDNVATAVATPVAGEPNPCTASDNAEAEAKHLVRIRFIDSLDGTIVKQVDVPYGGSTTPPEMPDHYGYNKVSWDGGIWENVFSDQNIFAIYEKRPGWYTDYNEDLTILDADIPLAGGYISNVGDCFD